MTDAAKLTGAVRAVLLSSVSERAIAPGIVSDIARRIAVQALESGVPPDDLLELVAEFGART